VTVDSFAAAEAAASVLRARTGYDSHDVAVVLGSGFARPRDALGPPSAEIAVGDLGGFPAPTVAGHAGTVRSVEIGPIGCSSSSGGSTCTRAIRRPPSSTGADRGRRRLPHHRAHECCRRHHDLTTRSVSRC